MQNTCSQYKNEVSYVLIFNYLYIYSLLPHTLYAGYNLF